jgi:hypothetical protein
MYSAAQYGKVAAAVVGDAEWCTQDDSLWCRESAFGDIDVGQV